MLVSKNLEVGIFLDISLQPELTSGGRQVAKDVSAAQDALINIFEHRELFQTPGNPYEVLPSAAMTDIVVKMMVEVLNILGIAY